MMNRDRVILESLYKQGVFAQRIVDQAIEGLRATGLPLVEYVIRHGLVADDDGRLATSLAEHYKLTPVDSTVVSVDLDYTRLLPAGFCREFHVALIRPFELAVEDPIDLPAIEMVETYRCRWVRVVVATREWIRQILDRAFPGSGRRFSTRSYTSPWRNDPTIDPYVYGGDASGVEDAMLRAATRLRGSTTTNASAVTTVTKCLAPTENAAENQRPTLRLIRGGSDDRE